MTREKEAFKIWMAVILWIAALLILHIMPLSFWRFHLTGLICATLILKYLNKNNLAKYQFEPRCIRGKYYIILTLIIVAILLWYSLATYGFIKRLAPLNEEDPVLQLVKSTLRQNRFPYEIVFMFLAVGLIYPIFEEFLYRGCVLHYYTNKIGFLKANILTAMIFSLTHMAVYFQHDWWPFFTLALKGLIYGYIFKKFNHIKFPIIMHSVGNISNFTMFIIVERALN